jgi:predicted SAM-dependent methyltransferase
MHNSGFHLEGKESLHLRLETPHKQVLPFFPSYDPSNPAPGVIVDYHDSNNVTGHQQRAFLVYWALRAFVESGGYPGIDGGGAGVLTPGCISIDLYGNEEANTYGESPYSGVNLKADCANLYMLQSNSFSCFVSNHLVEHLPCDSLSSDASQAQRMQLGCTGKEIAPVISENWIRLVQPGGYICLVFPDESAAQSGGSSVFLQDPSHQHGWTADTFFHNVLVPLTPEVDILEYDTFKNNFSVNCVLRKKD